MGEKAKAARAAECVEWPKCVEHGVWTPLPSPPPEGPLVRKLKDVDPEESRAVKRRGVMTFHLTGCTGHFQLRAAQQAVADAMAKQAVDPPCFGGRANAAPSSFFFHLGDIVYKDEDQTDAERADQQKLYSERFYAPYTKYPRNIFAAAGNHDGKDSLHPEKSAVRHFLLNFCDASRTASPDNLAGGRPTMTQPHVYWVLRTPLAHVIVLYANDVNGGQLDDPNGDEAPQYDWLVRTLRAIRRGADGRAVLIAVHYPPYSAAASFPERGDPNLGPTPHRRPLQPLALILRQAFHEAKLLPDAVFSAHAHHYQRLSYVHADRRRVPYLIAGGGGHPPIEPLGNPCAGCDGDKAVRPPTPVPSVVTPPPWLPLPEGDRLLLSAYNDQDFGFLRVTIDQNEGTLCGEYFAAYRDADKSFAPTLSDAFVLNLRDHTVVRGTGPAATPASVT